MEIDEALKFGLLMMAIASILSQMSHANYVVKMGSNLSDKDQTIRGWNVGNPRDRQAYLFSIIIATAIMFTVLLKMHLVALFWTLIEAAIGIIYQYDGIEYKTNNKNFKDPTKIKKIAGYFMAVLIPFCIYAFSFMYAEFDWITEIFKVFKNG